MIKCTPELYATVSFSAARSYIDGVMDGSISTSKWIKKAVERGINDRKSGKWILDEDKVREVYEFCSMLSIPNSKGKIEQFRLSPYQAWMIYEIFLYYDKEDGSRRFTEVVYWTGRKSGKTMIAAIISFYLALAAGYDAPETYFAASGQKQATQLLRYCKQVRRNSEYIKVRTESKAFHIATKNDGVFEAVANKVGGELDGKKPLTTVLDECHALPDNQLRSAFKRGMNWSTDTMFLSISTAGKSITNYFYNQIKEGKKILETDPSADEKTLYLLFTLDDGDLDRDDLLDNPDIWIKANPNLGVTPPIKVFKDDMNKSWLLEADRGEFIVKNLNVFDDEHSIGKLFDISDVNRNSKDLNIEDFYGCNVYLGLDLAPKVDISALAAIVEKDGQFYSWVDLFCAGHKDALFRKGTKLNLMDFKDEISINYGKPRTDYNAIKKRIQFYAEKFNIIGLGYDPAYSSTLVSDVEGYGIDLYSVKQYHASFNEVVLLMENALADDTLTLKNNRLLRFMFFNALEDQNKSGMRMAGKKESKIHGDAIDGVVAIMTAFNIYIGMNVTTSSIYKYLHESNE